MISIKEVTKEYDGKEILKDINLDIQRGYKMALVGPNGAGKSTLLKIIAGEMTFDSGEIKKQDNLEIGYLPQDLKDIPIKTIIDFLLDFCDLSRSKSILDKFDNGQSLSEHDIKEYNDALSDYLIKDGYSFEHKASIMLEGFGFSKNHLEVKTSDLSVGQKTKVFLIGILLKKPDLLIFDEPTNNLDIASIIWLEEYLKKQEITIIVTSHDVLFLDAIISRVAYMDMHNHTLNVTRGTFGDYLERLDKDSQRQKQQYREFTEEKERLEERMREYRIKTQKGSNFQGTDNDKFARGAKRDQAGKSGKQAKSIEKRIEQMVEIDKPIEKKELQIFINPEKKGGSIKFENTVVGYKDFSLAPFSFSINFGAKIALIGPNGTGKSTILKSLIDRSVIISGDVQIDKNLIIGNFMQQHENLPFGDTVIEFLSQKIDKPRNELFSTLVKHGFNIDSVNKLIKILSPGERARLLFTLFSEMKVNVLLLDEPTNHLDIEAIDALTEMLQAYEGTVFIVTHDRTLLKKEIVNDFYLVDNNKVVHLNDYVEYIRLAERKAQKLLSLF